MCVFCAAIPVAAAAGTALDNKQRKKARAQGRTLKLARPFVLLTIAVVFLLVIGSAIVHLRYSYLWL